MILKHSYYFANVKAAVFVLLALFALAVRAADEPAASGLGLEDVGTEKVYFTYNGKPLLSFGGLSDFLFYGDQDCFDYKLWADWAARHGINHVRAYPPLSYKYIEKFTAENGGDPKNILFPYVEVPAGSRKFDLRRFDERYWKRFRAKCEYLKSRGIIIHLLMWNGWQLRAADTPGANESDLDWDGHFFNPLNNINDFTKPLGGELENRFKIYYSMADKNGELLNAQRWWFHKLVEETADLGNVYYDVVHELAEHYRDWDKTRRWVEEMALSSLNLWVEIRGDVPMIIGMDTGGLTEQQRRWVFTRPYFNVLIYGKKHTYEQARDWRIEFKKPYVPQESWDENGEKYSYRCPNQRTAIRKYMWKFLMAKCQQLDLYMKPRTGSQATDAENPPGYPHNYDPRGWNKFETDAITLRLFWRRLRTYGDLWFDGRVASGPGDKRYVLSSSSEAVVYCSSAVGREGVRFAGRKLAVRGTDLADGSYMMDVINPTTGTYLMQEVKCSGGDFSGLVPDFVDDIVVYVHKSDEQAGPGDPNSSAAAEGVSK